jgi:hypothetical protein
MRILNHTVKAINSKYTEASGQGRMIKFSSSIMNNGTDKSLLGMFMTSAYKTIYEGVSASNFKSWVIEDANKARGYRYWATTNFATNYWSFLNQNDIISYDSSKKTWKIGTRFMEALSDMKALKDISAKKITNEDKEEKLKCVSSSHNNLDDYQVERSDEGDPTYVLKTDAPSLESEIDNSVTIKVSTSDKSQKTSTMLDYLSEVLSKAITKKGIQSVTEMLIILSK